MRVEFLVTQHMQHMKSQEVNTCMLKATAQQMVKAPASMSIRRIGSGTLTFWLMHIQSKAWAAMAASGNTPK